MPWLLFKNRENLEFALEFNKIGKNLEFYIFKIAYEPKFGR